MWTLGFDWSTPVRHAREYLTRLRGLLSAREATFSGTENSPSSAAVPAGVLATTPSVLMCGFMLVPFHAGYSPSDGTLIDTH